VAVAVEETEGEEDAAEGKASVKGRWRWECAAAVVLVGAAAGFCEGEVERDPAEGKGRSVFWPKREPRQWGECWLFKWGRGRFAGKMKMVSDGLKKKWKPGGKRRQACFCRKRGRAAVWEHKIKTTGGIPGFSLLPLTKSGGSGSGRKTRGKGGGRRSLEKDGFRVRVFFCIFLMFQNYPPLLVLTWRLLFIGKMLLKPQNWSLNFCKFGP
jgi:hypothetical protein